MAVSGGLDSISLMHLLHRTQRAHKGILEVVSIDHGLRAESAEEVLFVQKQAEELQLPFFTTILDLKEGGNLQERARIARQEVLLSRQSTRIATGHHANDQAETVLYRMLRGSGLDGLSGMRPLHAPWCRPLLELKRSELLLWAQTEGLEWIEDPSNPLSLRGRMRAIFPLLDELHGDSVSALSRSAELLASDASFLERYTDEVWERCFDGTGLVQADFEKNPFSIRIRLLRKLCLEQGVPIRARLLQRIAQSGVDAHLPSGYRLRYGVRIYIQEE